jgi:integrase
MPRKTRDEKLDTRTARLKLTPRREPYWRHWQEGRALGYRRLAGGKAGTWVARFYDPAGERVRKFQVLGQADDLIDADGGATLTFVQAQDKAVAWFRQVSREDGRVVEALTVSGAMAAYVADYAARGGKDKKGVEFTIAAHIEPKLGDKTVASLTSGMIRTWHRALATAAPRVRISKDPKKSKPTPQPKETESPDGQRARRASANRVLTVLKAALNIAYADGRVISDEAWRRVKPFKGTSAPRIRHFPDSEAKRLVNASSEDFRPMIQAALLTGARYGELVRLRAADFNVAKASLHIRAGKTNKPRDVALTDEAVKFFKVHAAGKIGHALMLTQPNGEAWGKSYQIRPMKAACKAANIVPAIGFHILRHAYASRLVMAGVPLGAVAAQIGDSEVTCAKHYAHHSPSSVADTVRASSPALGIVPDSNLISLVG